MLDVVSLVVSVLSPFLPKLIGKAVESAGAQIGTDGWNQAKKIWDLLHPEIEAKPEVMRSVNAVAKLPDDADFRNDLQNDLQQLLADNPNLAEAISQILKNDQLPAPETGTQINQTVTTNEGQIIGQMTGGKVIGRIDGTIQGNINL